MGLSSPSCWPGVQPPAPPTLHTRKGAPTSVGPAGEGAVTHVIGASPRVRAGPSRPAGHGTGHPLRELPGHLAASPEPWLRGAPPCSTGPRPEGLLAFPPAPLPRQSSGSSSLVPARNLLPERPFPRQHVDAPRVRPGPAPGLPTQEAFPHGPASIWPRPSQPAVPWAAGGVPSPRALCSPPCPWDQQAGVGGVGGAGQGPLLQAPSDGPRAGPLQAQQGKGKAVPFDSLQGPCAQPISGPAAGPGLGP